MYLKVDAFVQSVYPELRSNQMVVQMPVVPGSPAPYTSPSAVMDVVERHRTKGMPTPIDGDVLRRAGISDSLVPRTLQALRTLDLIDADGNHTPVLEGIRRAPEAEYKQRLVEWLNAAYADALQYIDPATDDETAVRDAFRNYEPIGQQDRMVTLFLGLYEKAGIIEKKAPAPRTPAPTRKVAPTRTARAPAPKTKPQDQNNNSVVPRFGNLPAALSGLLADLPTIADGWTTAERDRFMVTFKAVLEFCFPADAPKRDNKTVEEDADP